MKQVQKNFPLHKQIATGVNPTSMQTTKGDITGGTAKKNAPNNSLSVKLPAKC